MKKHVKACATLLVAFSLFLGASGTYQAKADENLIGFTSDFARLYINSDDKLGVASTEFVNDETTTLFSIDGKPQLLSQFAVAAINSYANVRTTPSTAGDIVGRMYPGAVATAISSENGWTKIISGNVEGYILSDFLKFGQDGVDYAEEYYKTHYRVVSNTLNLRAEPNTNSTIKAQLFTNASLVLLEKTSDSWFKIRWEGTASSVTGYVSTDYISNDHRTAVTLEEAKNFENQNSYQLANIIWPLPGDHTIHSYFGPRKAPTAGASTYHKGLDIGGAYGLNIVAALSGTVETVSYDGSSGHYVTIDHGNGVKTKYLHCSKTLVYVGQKVTQGETIAKVGDSGVATGPHLHFSLVINGSFVDPYPYLKSVH